MGVQAARLVTTWVLSVQDVCRTVFFLLYLCAIDVDNVDHWEPLQIQSE